MGGKGSGRAAKIPKPKTLLKSMIPVNDLFDKDELSLYRSLVDIYLQDFDDELTAADQDDIMTLAVNKILEIRLLKISKDEVGGQLEISSALEKIRKQTDKVKESLSSRRKDRVDPNKLKGFSIVNLAVAFDDEKRAEFEERERKMRLENEKATKALNNHIGNRYDLDDTNKDNNETG